MKKKIFIPMLFLVSLLFPRESHGQAFLNSVKQNHSGPVLLLMHPTVHNLRTVINLMEKELIVAEEIRMVGVYHHKERYNYGQSRTFLDTVSNLPADIFLHRIKDSISSEMLYAENELSDDYATIFEQSSGVIFFGGPDLPPETYDEKTNLLTSIYDPYRHYFELSFLFHLLGGKQNPDFEPLLEQNSEYLIYGFCLGMQTMNVATGGTMIQDIPTQVYGALYAEDIIKMDINKKHRNYYRTLSIDENLLSGSFHQIHFLKDSYLKTFRKEQLLPVVYSNHHQAVKKTGKGFEAIAASLDGEITEAIQHQKYVNVKGVQFHPEAMLLYRRDILFKRTPRDTTLSTGPVILEEASSTEFHEKFWKDFSNRLIQTKR